MPGTPPTWPASPCSPPSPASSDSEGLRSFRLRTCSRAVSRKGAMSSGNLTVSTRDSLVAYHDPSGVTSFSSGHLSMKSEGVKVVCVGMMHTGLKTLHRAFESLGYQNIYDQNQVLNTFQEWDRVFRDGDESALREIFQGHEVVMGMPTFCFWEQIVHLYPNAKVILTVRDEDDWWQSICHTWQSMHTELPGAPFNQGSRMRLFEQWLAPSYHKYCEALRFAWKSTLGVDALGSSGELNEIVARNSFKRHNASLQATLEDQIFRDGSPRFLVYNVASDGWAPLCNFLERAIPDVEFPKVAETSSGGNLLPDLDSKFADAVRHELRRGFLVGAFATTLFVAFFMALAAHRFTDVPTCSLVLLSVTVLAVGWNIHVVLQGLVSRVPALFIVPTAIKGLLIAATLQGCFISYSILKEMLVTQDKIASPVLVLSSRLGAVLCALVYLLSTEGNVVLEAPIQSIAAFAITNEASTWASYEMLKYVAFPVQVMAKSVKMLPSLLMGRLMHGSQYSWLQYGQACLAFACVAVVNFNDADEEMKSSLSEDLSATYKMGMGVLMLAFFFVCDSFTPQWQAALYKKHPKLTQVQMMLGGNMLGFIVTAGTAGAAWPKIRASLGQAATHPAIAGRIACLGAIYALGQFCIYSAIRLLGPLTFTWIMTARQLLSVFISLVLFGHGISPVKVGALLLVLTIMTDKQLTEATQGVGSLFRTPSNSKINIGSDSSLCTNSKSGPAGPGPDVAAAVQFMEADSNAASKRSAKLPDQDATSEGSAKSPALLRVPSDTSVSKKAL